MGLLDRIKTFAKGGGLELESLAVNPNPLKARYSPSGSVRLKGRDNCTVLSVLARLVAEKTHGDGRVEKAVLDETRHISEWTGADTDLRALEQDKHGFVATPFDVKGSSEFEFRFHLINVNLEERLGKLGYSSLSAANDASELRIFAEVEADVKGSPFDPRAEVAVALADD